MDQLPTPSATTRSPPLPQTDLRDASPHASPSPPTVPNTLLAILIAEEEGEYQNALQKALGKTSMARKNLDKIERDVLDTKFDRRRTDDAQRWLIAMRSSCTSNSMEWHSYIF